ncbi:hypothetical protein GCM10009765_27750 [Fodinicola feengrottensis]|uniref:Uncharacterized protein n=2 Tax=Fodinicola feengrottensis TaxID=435914 RepID=A0ABN2GU82_9ACTN
MALGFATALGATAVTTLFPAAVPWWVLALGVAAALVVVSRWMSVGAAAFTAVVGWLCVEGFLLSTDGTLHWHGPQDLVVLAIGLVAVLALPLWHRLRA